MGLCYVVGCDAVWLQTCGDAVENVRNEHCKTRYVPKLAFRPSDSSRLQFCKRSCLQWPRATGDRLCNILNQRFDDPGRKIALIQFYLCAAPNYPEEVVDMCISALMF